MNRGALVARLDFDTSLHNVVLHGDFPTARSISMTPPTGIESYMQGQHAYIPKDYFAGTLGHSQQALK